MKQQPACGHWDGAAGRYCAAVDGVRHYRTGHRCPAHTPAALAGRPEPQPGPGWSAAAWRTPSPQSASRVHDAQAVASGKRRASPHVYRAARAAVGKEPRP